LDAPLRVLAAETSVLDVNDFLNMGAEVAPKLSERPLLLLPMVTGGQTLAHILQRLQTEGRPLPNVLTILTTKYTDSAQRIRDLPVIGKQTARISCLRRVDQKVYLPGDCPMCKLHLPASNREEDKHLMLSTYDMWDMIEEVGWRSERPVPRHRKSLGNLPRFLELVERNEALFASKIQLLLAAQPSGFPSDPVVVCPDEPGANHFRESLRTVLGIPSISIPRDALNRIVDDKRPVSRLLESWASRKESWFQQLVELSTEQVILMDEFNASGRTRAAMYTLLTGLGRNCLYYISILDLDPESSVQSDIPTYSLYQMQKTHR
jgi:pyrimidine operon attenuation protein/uracil phosphoribosyltransferase